MRTSEPLVGAATQMLSIVMLAARIFPPLWSVWLPMISLRPGAEKYETAPASPKCSTKPLASAS